MGRALTRRGFLASVVAVAASSVGAVALAAPGAAGGSSVAYRLAPTAACRCRACRIHGANRLLLRADAPARAHVGCRCDVVAVTVAADASTLASWSIDGDSVDARRVGDPALRAQIERALAAAAV